MKRIGTAVFWIALLLSCLTVVSYATEGRGEVTTPKTEIDGVHDISDADVTREESSDARMASSTRTSYPEYRIREEEGSYVLSDGEGDKEVRADNLQQITDCLPAGGALYVRFDSVKTDQNLTLTDRHLSVSGNLTFEGTAGVILSGDGSFEIDGGTLSFTDGGIRIKEGILLLSDGTVESHGTAITSDYSSSARFCMRGGKVLSGAADSAVENRLGTVTVVGGKIIGDNGAAVFSEGTLQIGGTAELSGKDTDVIATLPITLTAEKIPFAGRLSLQLIQTFEKGRETLAAYGAVAGMETRIALTDGKGNACPLVYRETGAGTDETNYLAVSLPYRYTCLVDGKTVDTLYGLKGEALDPPAAPSVKGYLFDGWYTDTAMTERMNFSFPPEADTVLYAKMTLLPPTFTLKGTTFIYDGELHDLTFLTLTHELEEKGLFSFEWYHDGALCPSSAKTVKLRDVVDSGIYYCKVTFTYREDSVTVTTPEVTVKIQKKQIEIPSPDRKIYDGKRQTSDLFDTADYTVTENDGGASVGRYPIVLQLKDPENCTFAGTDEDTVTLEFTVLRAENSFLGEVTISDYFEGKTPSPFAVARFGTPEFLYATSPDGEYRAQVPQAPGRYYLCAEVAETENYTGIRSAPIPFSVKEITVLSIRVATPPRKTVYTAFETFSPEGMSLLATLSDGSEREVDLSFLSFSYPDGGSAFHVASPYLILSYERASVRLPVTVTAARYPMEKIGFSDLTLVYDGEAHAPQMVGDLPVGKDGSVPCASVSGVGTDAGIYTITLTFRSESRDYLTPPPMTATLTILPKKTEIVFGETTFVYSGGIQCPQAWFTDVFGKKVYLSVLGGKSEAGDGYTATAVTEDKNYLYSGSIATFSIKKAVYDLSGVFWSAKSFVYDGDGKSVTLSGLPDGVGVIGYADAVGIFAGEYTARVTLSYDAKNYEAPQIAPYRWRIEKAEYPKTFSYPESAFVFDGAAHIPRLTGTLPVGADGSVPIPVFDRTVTHVAEGKCTVRITFTTESENYFAPAEIVSAVTVLPCPTRVDWGTLTFTYSGAECLPTASAAAFGVSVSGAAVDAGEYVATARSLSEDYTIENQTEKFRILPAENHWIKPLLTTIVYESNHFCEEAIPCYGKSIIRFFSDSELENEIGMPRTHGVYYMRAEVPASRNYLPLVGECVMLTLIEVVPVSLRVTLGKDVYVAFDRLDSADFTAELLYNDGTAHAIGSDGVRVTYRSADAFRASDASVDFYYGSLSASVPVTVKKRVPDFSGVRVSEDCFFYDGILHEIRFCDLPDGFSVLSYEGAEVLCAGEYTVTARLAFDHDNYDAPDTLSRRVTVLRALVPLPELADLVYDGTYRSPVVPPSSLYTVIAGDGEWHVGVYSVTLCLTDPENYRFAIDGADASRDRCDVSFTVLPRKLRYRLSDITVYRGEAAPFPEVTLAEGDILPGEDPGLRIFEDGGRFLLACDNPDYAVEFSGGEIRVLSGLSPARIRSVFFFVLLGLLLLFLLFLLFLHREKIRCRLLLFREEREARRARQGKTELPVPAGLAEPSEETFFAKDTADAESGDEAEAPVRPVEEPQAAEDDAVSEEEDTATEESPGEKICVETADALITDALARELLVSEETTIPTSGGRRGVVNVDTLSRHFIGGDRVDINLLKEKTLIPYDTGYLKVLARGIIDKPLTVYADDFSLQAVKMIALSGGEAVRARSVSPKEKK